MDKLLEPQNNVIGQAARDALLQAGIHRSTVNLHKHNNGPGTHRLWRRASRLAASCSQSKQGPGSVFRPGAMSECPTTS